MDQVVTLLQNITQTAYKTRETIKTIASYPESSDISYIYQLNILLDNIKVSGTRSVFKIIAGSDKAELQEGLHTIFLCMESVETLYGRLKSTYPESISPSLKDRLELNMKSMKSLMVLLASRIIYVYGCKDAACIITPSFQSLNGDEVIVVSSGGE